MFAVTKTILRGAGTSCYVTSAADVAANERLADRLWPVSEALVCALGSPDLFVHRTEHLGAFHPGGDDLDRQEIRIFRSSAAKLSEVVVDDVPCVLFSRDIRDQFCDTTYHDVDKVWWGNLKLNINQWIAS